METKDETYKGEQLQIFLQRQFAPIAKYLYNVKEVFVGFCPFLEDDILYFSICFQDKDDKTIVRFKISLIDALEWRDKTQGGKENGY